MTPFWLGMLVGTLLGGVVVVGLYSALVLYLIRRADR